MELLPPPQSGRRNDLSPVGDRFGLPKNQVYQLRKVYRGLPESEIRRAAWRTSEGLILYSNALASRFEYNILASNAPCIPF